MRVGICAFWFNRGQGVVARQLRTALDELGHETFVLGRPTKESFPMPQEAREDDVWAQSGVTPASDFFIPAEELVGWAKETGIEACFFDQNYEFDAIASLRGAGVRTIGRFVWERFSDEHVEPAKRAYDLVYSLTRAEQERYGGLGIETRHLAVDEQTLLFLLASCSQHPELRSQLGTAESLRWRMLDAHS